MIDDTSDAHLWNAAVDAKTGALLNDGRLDLARQRRRAQAAQRTEHAAAQRDARLPAPFAAVSPPNPVLDGSAYRVFAWPNESPNDAGRTLVANPADSIASPFGWHDINDAAGPEFITTQGNNVHAYMDQDANNAPDFGSSPSGGSALRFDFPIDLTQHAQAYRDAATTNLFYANNMIHDVLYRYGFDEVSGNFQDQQLRPRRHRRRRRARRGRRRQRHQQRQLLHPGRRRRRAADADVPVAGQPARRRRTSS